MLNLSDPYGIGDNGLVIECDVIDNNRNDVLTNTDTILRFGNNEVIIPML